MQNLVDVGRQEGVCVERAFFVTFVFFFVLLLTPTGHTRRPITTVYGSKCAIPCKVGPFGGCMLYKR